MKLSFNSTRWLRPRRVFAAAALVLLAAASLTCSPAYVLRAGWEEGRILSRRRPIETMIADPATSDIVREKLQLVQQARTFATNALDLEAGDSYTTYSRVDSDTLLLVLAGSAKDRFEPVTWWFPIVGNVPYKGFFDPDDAYDAAADLERRGFDTYLRPASAFSTLGWFNDPVLSTILDYDDVSLVATVIHELTHNTIFVPSQVAFNESFASFVGDRGAAAYFCALEGETGARCRLARDAWADNLVFGGFLQTLIGDLEAVYARTDVSREEKIRLREAAIDAALDEFRTSVLPQLQTRAFRSFGSRPVNNASLMARRLYFDRLDRFEAVFQAHRGDLPATLRAIRGAVDGAPDPWVALEHASGGG